MKLNELLNVNTPMIKVTRRRRNSNSSQNLIMGNINRDNAVDQVHSIIDRVMKKYLSDDPAEFAVKMVDTNPIIFNIIAPTAADYFQFTVSFPEGMEDIQKALIEKIGKTRSV